MNRKLKTLQQKILKTYDDFLEVINLEPIQNLINLTSESKDVTSIREFHKFYNFDSYESVCRSEYYSHLPGKLNKYLKNASFSRLDNEAREFNIEKCHAYFGNTYTQFLDTTIPKELFSVVDKSISQFKGYVNDLHSLLLSVEDKFVTEYKPSLFDKVTDTLVYLVSFGTTRVVPIDPARNYENTAAHVRTTLHKMIDDNVPYVADLVLERYMLVKLNTLYNAENDAKLKIISDMRKQNPELESLIQLTTLATLDLYEQKNSKKE